MSDFLTTAQGRRLALVRHAGQGMPVLFLGGFRSDMTGQKALFLDGFARERGLPFARFDYSGHGASDGVFEEGCIGDWMQDAAAILDHLGGRAILVGSSMGGWIALLLARARPEAVAGLVTIAAAPDFTEDGYWAGFDAAQRAQLQAEGVVHVPSDYGAPYPITRQLIEDGRTHLLLRSPLPLPMPVRCLQGTADVDVPPAWALRLLDHASGPDIRLTLVKGADHRFSTPDCLDLIGSTLAGLLAAPGPG